MKTARMFVICGIAAMVWAGAAGGITYDLTGVCRIWDISGTYDDEDGLEDSLDLAQDGKGKITGSGYWSETEDEFTLNATYTVKGQVKTGPYGSTSVQIQITHNGTASVYGEIYKFSAKQKIMAVIDPDNLEMNGWLETSVSMAGQRVKETEVFNEDLPVGMDGSAILTLVPETDMKGRIIGSGICKLANLEEISFDVKGSPSSKTGTIKLKLSGRKDTDDSGAKIQMEVSGDYEDIATMEGKVMGQKIATY